MSDNGTTIDGKYVGNLETFTFNSGKTCRIKRVSPMLSVDVQRGMEKQKPKPPVNRVNYGTDAEPIWKDEANPADPDYIDQLAEFEQKKQLTFNRLLVERGVMIEIDQEELAQLRADMVALGVELEEGSDKYIYVTRVCVDGDDWPKLIRAILGQSQPSQEAVGAAQDTFRGAVARA